VKFNLFYIISANKNNACFLSTPSIIMYFYKPTERAMISLLLLGFLAYNVINMFVYKDIDF